MKAYPKYFTGRHSGISF